MEDNRQDAKSAKHAKFFLVLNKCAAARLLTLFSTLNVCWSTNYRDTQLLEFL